VEPGYFGLYTDSGRYMLKEPGIHLLWSCAAKWEETADSRGILIDDEANINRKFGDKVILQVPENHLAGGFRVGAVGDQNDQEFVLFSQGRHVLPESKFYGVTVVELNQARNILGPLTILYVKEGEMGGAFDRQKGQYRLLYPGPPYVLHEQSWEQVEVTKRAGEKFRLGPYEFVTVMEGKMAGATRKDTGEFQILPHGKSYQLHEKDFYPVEIVERTENFKIGPYFFVTVQTGYEAGCFRVDTNQWVRLEAGHTYQLNKKDFYEPQVVQKTGHKYAVGPLTFVTVKDGQLNGAFRVKDGTFEEFTEVKEYVLHDKVYFGLVSCEKNLPVKQEFGPQRVITIREGFKGVFEEEGQIRIKEPGFYKVPANTEIYDSICVKVFQDNLSFQGQSEIEFRTKDGIRMQVKCALTWQVEDAEMVAKFGGAIGSGSAFDHVRKQLQERACDQVIKQCKMYNRKDLLPTETDLDHLRVEGRSDKEVAAMAEKMYAETLATITAKVVDELKNLSQMARMGVNIFAVSIDLFKLLDLSILENLEKITTSRTEAAAAIAASEAKRDAETSKAEAEKVAAVLRAEQEAKITQMRTQEVADKQTQEAESAAAQAEITAKSKARIAELAYEAETKEKHARAKAKADVDALEAATVNKIEKEREQTKDTINVSRAEAEAKAIMAKAEAEYQMKLKEAEAGSKMPQQEFELKKLELHVQMMSNIAKEVGQAAWKYPDVYTGFIEEFADKLRLGPMAANEILAAHMNKKADIDGEAGMKPPAGGGLFPLAGNLRSGR
jgi:regulator of protease activity HflC (stomatin/prohibitin superfamily)